MNKDYKSVLTEKIRECNESSDYFVFADTELSKNYSKNKSFKILSQDLKNSLNSLLDNNESPFYNIEFSDVIYLEVSEGKNVWIRVNKKNLSGKKIENNTLCLLRKDYTFLTSEKDLLYNFGGPNLQLGTKLIAIKQIDTEVQKFNINHHELLIDYLFILPDNCHCEIKPTGHPDNDFLYSNHIQFCLDTIEKVNNFKDEIISQIRIKAQLLKHKKQIIQEIQNYSQTKGLIETELSSVLGDNWREELKGLLRETDVNYYKGEFLKLIDLKVESKTQDTETRQKTEEEIRKEREILSGEKEQENLNNEKQKDEKANPYNQNNNNPSPEKDKQTSTNSLPSPIDIQNHYNSDKDKLVIENNPTLTDSKEKQQANEFLKIVISGELLVKKGQINPKVLTKLITEKKNNTSLYQLLNKESRIDKVISELENIQKDSSNKSLYKNKINNKIPLGFVIGSTFFVITVIVLRTTFWIKRKKIINDR